MGRPSFFVFKGDLLRVTFSLNSYLVTQSYNINTCVRACCQSYGIVIKSLVIRLDEASYNSLEEDTG